MLLLVRLSIQFPRRPPQELLRIHDEYPQFHSHHSFNLILDLLVNIVNPRLFQSTLARMKQDGFGNHHTRRLLIRHLISRGQYDAAIQVAQPVAGDRMDPDIAIELMLNSAARSSLLSLNRINIDAVNIPNLLSQLTQPSPSPRFIHPVVQILRGLGQYQEAYDLTLQYLHLLPPNISLPARRLALDLVHENLRISPATFTKKPPSHIIPFTSVISLLSLHPQVKPNAYTLELAMEWLRRRMNRSILALQMLSTWRRKWGPEVESTAIRRKVASFAISQHNVPIIKQMVRRELTARRTESNSIPFHLGTYDLAAETGVRSRDDYLWGRILCKLVALDGKLDSQHDHLPNTESSMR